VYFPRAEKDRIFWADGPELTLEDIVKFVTGTKTEEQSKDAVR